ncbi:hypothetical protein ACSBR1_011980 [Camellia fascicularis]
MNSNSNGQSPFAVDGSAIQQTQPPAPRQLSSVDTNTDTTTGNTQNQYPSTSHDCQTRTRTRTQTQTRAKTRSWFEILPLTLWWICLACWCFYLPIISLSPYKEQVTFHLFICFC